MLAEQFFIIIYPQLVASYSIVLLVIVQASGNRTAKKKWRAPLSLKPPMSWSRVQINFLRHSNAVFLFVPDSQMINLTNKNTVLPRARINFLRHNNAVLLFVPNSQMINLTNKNTVLPRARINFLRHNNAVFLFVPISQMINLTNKINSIAQSPNKLSKSILHTFICSQKSHD